MKFLLITAFVFSLASVAMAQSVDLAKLNSSAAGKRVVEYFNTFNTGDEEKLRAFFLDNIAPQALKERPVEPRLAFHRQLRADIQKAEIKKIVSVADNEIDVLAQSVNGQWISYGFSLDPTTTKFLGFRIEEADGPGERKDAFSEYNAPASLAEAAATADKLFSDLTKADAFSGVVMIAKDGKPVFGKAYGFANTETKTPNNIDTRFNLGSINKDFTVVAIGQLMKQGKLAWDDKLIKFLPDYPNKEAAAKITIGQLVTMQSGIGDFVNDEFWSMDRTKLRDLSDFFNLFATKPLLFEPGTSRRYSNGGYIVLGLIIEKLSGMSYYDYVRENVFKPAGMNDTGSFFMDKLPPNTAFGYTTHHQEKPGRGGNNTILSARGSSAGGGYSTASDLLKFVAALRSGKLSMPDDSGVFHDKFGGIGTAGGSEGVNSLLEDDERSGYTVIVLSNIDPPSAERPGMKLMEWLRQIKQ
jgi:CubicO group peptidase (beta-lactamase class C family)